MCSALESDGPEVKAVVIATLRRHFTELSVVSLYQDNQISLAQLAEDLSRIICQPTLAELYYKDLEMACAELSLTQVYQDDPAESNGCFHAVSCGHDLNDILQEIRDLCQEITYLEAHYRPGKLLDLIEIRFRSPNVLVLEYATF